MGTTPNAIIHNVSRHSHDTILLLLVLLASLALAATAHAGIYSVTACNEAPNGVNNSWEPFNTDPTHLQTRLSCPYTTNQGQQANQENGISTTDILELANGAQPGTEAGWTFTAPTGTTIAGITYQRMLSTLDEHWIPGLRADGSILPEQTCTPPIAGSCLVGSGPGGENQATITGLSAHTLTLGLRCAAPTGQQCITGGEHFHAAVATMYSAAVTITDPTPPTLDTPTGSLWEPGKTNGYHKGTETVTVSAQDTGGGVQNITLHADGHPIATYEATCDFTHPQPCPASTGEQTLLLPTTELSDGPHTLSLIATDAAGNESLIASREIITANNPPSPPTELNATPSTPGSSIFTATWTDPANPIVPITTATYQICPPNGACTDPTEIPAIGPATVTVPGPGIWTLALWLTNAAGNSSPTEAAHTMLIVMPGSTSGVVEGGSSQTTSTTDEGKDSSDTKSPHTSRSTTAKATIHATERLRGRKLIVHVTGPSTGGQVYVRYTDRSHGKLIALAAKKATLRHGKLTVIFILPKQVAAHTRIQVTARLMSSRASRPACSAALASVSVLRFRATLPDRVQEPRKEAHGAGVEANKDEVPLVCDISRCGS
jgi:hypothetical protein